MGNKREINERKRNNARLYPIYKMLSWDLLCFYSIEFLFYTKTKGVTASEVLIINAFYMLYVHTESTIYDTLSNSIVIIN